MQESTLAYDIVRNQFSSNLEAFLKILIKAKAHSEAHKFSPEKYLDLKFSPDMFNFLKQVQIITDNAKGAASRLSGKTAPVFPDTETTFEQLELRVRNTIDFLNSISNEEFNQFDSRDVTFPWYPGKKLNSRDYLIGFALPNFYFHLTTAYDLLRHAGVSLGKADYLGNLNWQNA